MNVIVKYYDSLILENSLKTSVYKDSTLSVKDGFVIIKQRGYNDIIALFPREQVVCAEKVHDNR